MSELSTRLRCETDQAHEVLEILDRLNLIEGPGAYGSDWLFRRLTARGCQMADEIGSRRQWVRIKKTYGVFD